jgi:hypothetical protein
MYNWKDIELSSLLLKIQGYKTPFSCVYVTECLESANTLQLPYVVGGDKIPDYVHEARQMLRVWKGGEYW